MTNPTGPPGRYTLDPRVSRFTVRAFAGGMLSALGHSPTFAVRDYTGEVHFDPDALDSASLKLTIPAASLSLVDDVSDRDRREIERVMREEVLEIAKYPEITYDCPRATLKKTGEGQFEVTMSGQLTLHGVTRAQQVSGRIVLTGGSIRAFGECPIRQTDYHIKPVSVAASMIKLKEELKVTYDVVART